MSFPLSPWEAAWCALAIAAGYAVRAVSGFGAGVIATPLLVFVLPLPVTVPLITVIGMFAGSRQVVRDWRAIDWASIARFVPGSLVGVALGLVLFTSLDQVLLAIRRQQQHRRDAGARQFLGSGDPVHPRHLDVHDHQVRA